MQPGSRALQPGNSRPDSESRGAATISAAIEYYGLTQCILRRAGIISLRRAGIKMPVNLIGH